MKPRHLEIIHVTWIDSEVTSGWTDLSSLQDSFQVNHSLGLLLHQDQQMLILAADYDPENDHFNRVMRIPAACVRDVKTLSSLKVPL